MLCELAFIIPWAYHGIRKRNLHQKYPFFLAVCFLMINIGMAMMWGGLRKWRCHNPTTPATMRNEPQLIAQALFTQGFGLSSNLWICCLLAHLLVRTITKDQGLRGPKGTLFGIPEWAIYHVVRSDAVLVLTRSSSAGPFPSFFGSLVRLRSRGPFPFLLGLHQVHVCSIDRY